MNWILVTVLSALLAGIVQGIIGFGSGIIIMSFLPYLLPINQSAGISALVMITSNIILVYKYRECISWRKLIGPYCIYVIVAAISVHLGKVLSVYLMKSLLGILFISLASYYIFFQKDNINIKIPLKLKVLIFSLISGFFSGLFGIGGPLMALYFLSIFKTKEEYLGNIQTFFLINSISITVIRISNGVLIASNIKFIVVGILGAILGTFIANKMINRINIHLISQIIYILIGISGVLYLFNVI